MSIYETYLSQPTNLSKCLFLYELHHNFPKDFFNLAKEHVTEFLPILYTPTIGDAVINYSKNYKFPLGLTISYENRGQIKRILENKREEFGSKEMSIAVVTDGDQEISKIAEEVIPTVCSTSRTLEVCAWSI